jgi:hypothetical protein
MDEYVLNSGKTCSSDDRHRQTTNSRKESRPLREKLAYCAGGEPARAVERERVLRAPRRRRRARPSPQ